MICCSFVFKPKEYDEEFNSLNEQIENFARSLPGFIKVENWETEDKKTKNAMYYYENLESVKTLSRFPQHLIAKKKVDYWYESYRVEIFKIETKYGNSEILNL